MNTARGKNNQGSPNFGKQEGIIENDSNEASTLTITVELQVATEKRSVWFPRLSCCDYTQLYESIETSDVVFIVNKEFNVHTNVLAVRARILYELVVTEEEALSSSSSSAASSSSNCSTIVVLVHVDEIVFEILLEFIYSRKVPTLNDNDNDEEFPTLILVAANRFGVTDLKLYMESVLIEKFLVPSNAARLLLLADTHSCALLKEESMNAYVTNSTTFMDSQDDWKQLQESGKLIIELLLYMNACQKRYSSVANDGNGTIENADELDVTSLRERLQRVDLDVDGSRVMIVECWKDYVRTNNNDKK